MKSIGESAFQACKALEQAELSVGLEAIEALAFARTALLYLYLPDGLKEFSPHAVDRVTLRIPSSLESLSEDERKFPDRLTGIEAAEDHPVYVCHDGIFCRRKDGVLLRCFKEIEGVFEIPADVKKIGYKAFSCQEKLTRIRIPEGIETIGEMAFRECGALESVELPASLKTIGREAFAGCKNLKRLEIPDGLERERSFVSDWDGLLSSDLSTPFVLSTPLVGELLRTRPVELHLTPGRDYAGLVTPAALEVLVEQDDVENFVRAESFAPELWDWLPDLLRHARFCGAAKMEAHLQELEQAGLAQGKKRRPLTGAQWRKLWQLSDNKDGTYTAKKYKGQFSHAILPEMIGKYKVAGVRDIGRKYEIGFLRSLTLSASITSIRIRFENMPQLERIEVSEDNPGYSSRDGILFSKAGDTLLRCPCGWKGKGMYIVPEKVKKIEGYAFAECENLRKSGSLKD